MTPTQKKLCTAVADAIEINDGKPVHMTAKWWTEVGSGIRTVRICLLEGYLLRESINGKLYWTLHPNTYAKIGRRAPLSTKDAEL